MDAKQDKAAEPEWVRHMNTPEPGYVHGRSVVLGVCAMSTMAFTLSAFFLLLDHSSGQSYPLYMLTGMMGFTALWTCVILYRSRK
jgi:hypothetical protein